MIYNKTLSNCYQTVIIKTVSSTRNTLDKPLYAGHVQAEEEITPQKRNHSTPLDKYKTSIYPSLLVLFILLLMAIPMPSYAAKYSPDMLRVYAHSRIVNYKEFKCFDKIIYRESRYNYLARNGSHFGLGQMRSKYYQSKDPFTQIDLTIKYSVKRYNTLCNALAFHDKHGYY